MKKNIRSYKGKFRTYIFWGSIFLSLLPFIILSFLNFMGGDDYIYQNLYRNLGFAGAQAELYKTWIGRFTATFIQITFVKFGWVSNDYYLHTLILIFFTYLSVFYLFKNINKHLLGGLYTKSIIVSAGAVFTLLNFYVFDDIASAIYWFSSAFTYQPAIILLFFLLGSHKKNEYDKSIRSPLLNYLINGTLVILICGCNETATILLFALLGCLITAKYFYKKKIDLTLLVYMVITFVAGIIIFITSGDGIRLKVIGTHSHYMEWLVIFLIRIIFILFAIFKEPLFWICGAVVFFAGINAPYTVNLNFQISLGSLLRRGLLWLGIFLIFSLLPLIIVTNGTLPSRAINSFSALILLYLFIFIFLAGTRFKKEEIDLNQLPFPRLVFIVILSVGILSSISYFNAWKSTIPAYFYHSIMVDRHKIILTAAKNNQQEVSIPSYKKALRRKYIGIFPGGTFGSVDKLLKTEPVDIRVFNHAEDNPYKAYFEFYRIKKINIDTSGRSP